MVSKKKNTVQILRNNLFENKNNNYNYNQLQKNIQSVYRE